MNLFESNNSIESEPEDLAQFYNSPSNGGIRVSFDKVSYILFYSKTPL